MDDLSPVFFWPLFAVVMATTVFLCGAIGAWVERKLGMDEEHDIEWDAW